MKTTTLALSLGALLSMGLTGCANHEPVGNGEYLELTSIHVQSQDLSTFTPTTVTRTDTTVATQKPQAVYAFTIKQGERYQAALKRWLTQTGYHNVAWSLTKEHAAVLDETNPTRITYQGSFKKAVNQFADKLGLPLNLIHDQRAGVMGVYDFAGQARITHVSGRSLKQVVQHLVENYGLRWDSDDGFSRSWLAGDDYRFGADYYLLTERDDIDTALSTVLEDYPVYSSIVESTGQVIIQENLQ